MAVDETRQDSLAFQVLDAEGRVAGFDNQDGFVSVRADVLDETIFYQQTAVEARILGHKSAMVCR
jgi:hypothetical protein